MKTIFDGENTITYLEWDLLKELIMTPTEIEAKAKAQSLLDEINLSIFHWGGINDIRYTSVIAIKICEETIGALNSVKGMGKIHKVKLWKLVKANLEAK
jgi:hypothetical protein